MAQLELAADTGLFHCELDCHLTKEEEDYLSREGLSVEYDDGVYTISWEK